MKTRLLLPLLLLQFVVHAQTSKVSRLISIGRDAYSNGAMGPLDSTQYFTSGNNICDLELGYQNDSSYLLSYYPNSGYKLTMRTVNTLCPQGYLGALQQNTSTGKDTLQNTYLHTYAYLPGGAVMDTLMQWNKTNNKWDYAQLCADTFFDPKHIRVHYYSNWDTGGWLFNARTQHTYTAAGNPDTLLDTYWDATIQQWAPNSMMKYSYDAANRLVNETYWLWQASTNSWIPSYQITTTYNLAGDSSVQQWYSWDKNSNSWTMNTRHIFAYNSKGQPLSDIEQYWLANTQSFMNWSRTRYTYNSYGQASSVSSERWNILDSAFEFGFQSMYTRYHYEEYTPTPELAVAEVSLEPSIMLYPNPGRDYVWLDWKGPQTVPLSIQLIDMQGKPVIQIQKVGNELHEALPTQQLPTGTYILQFTANGHASQRMLQVVH